MNRLRIWILFMVMYVVYGAPQGSSSDKDAKIISESNDISPDGGYAWSFETDNGIKAQETGTLTKAKDAQSEDSIAAQGSYSYTDKEGNKISLTYVADGDGGFRPEGAHLPTPPPVPPMIQKALDFIASQPSTTERAGKRK